MSAHELFIEPWLSGAWMWRGMLAAALVAIPCALLGVFLYLRRRSLVADAHSHLALPGIVLAFLVTGEASGPAMLVGAALVGLGASFAIEALSRRRHVRADAAIGIVFTPLFALGVILLSTLVHDAHIDTQCVLFGNVLGISNRSLGLLAVVAPTVVLGVALFYRWLAVSSFDTAVARTLGVPASATHYGLMTLVALTAMASFEAVGAILVIAMIIVPAASAHVLTDRLPAMLIVSVAHNLAAALLGMYVSIWLDCSTAGAMVVASGVLYALAFLFAPRHGALRGLRRGAMILEVAP